ncbi:hypothetical protein M011DRAFT_527865 [Sporormia fimetaria CBS 119925]|uniref:CMP/dCMP-type deaminase domain-containing protein n=1 Tax=Sporormia fimetaria CBS 119925 TaxID=1340428 RepID=A0A6A6V5S9_9PLEO|nr:hypothetical protein M011DRAFT_527865 [Sporormia fimetaria CBS 119925]
MALALGLCNSGKKHGVKSGKKIQQHRLQRPQCAAKSRPKGIVAPCYKTSSVDSRHSESDRKKSPTSNSGKLAVNPFRIDSKNSKIKHPQTPTPTTQQPRLLPTNKPKHSLTSRHKHPRLHGADLYVARLGYHTCSRSPHLHSTLSTPTSKSSTTFPTSIRRPTGCLHDELSCSRTPLPSLPHSPPILPLQQANTTRAPPVLASRPCYRCVAYMASVGIKRVFWTMETGAWEGAKVRDLMDAMDELGV